ncbi:MAG: PEGA domain-containing protein [Blastocatellia bacterium]
MNFHRSILYLSLAGLLACAISEPLVMAFGQPSTPKPAPTPKRGASTSPEPKPKRGEPIIEKVGPPGPGPNKEVIIKVVTPNEGALVLWVVPEATVTLIPLQNGKKVGSPRGYDLGQGDTLTFPLISPGKYRINVVHPDYNLFTDTITIAKGKPTALALLPLLVSKYGSINVVGAPPGARILLDGKELDPGNAKSTGEEITIARILVGKHKLKVSKEGNDDLERELDVLPGETVSIPANLVRVMVAVTFNSEPGAKLYVDDEEKGTVDPTTRKVKVSLRPGSYRARMTKEGYETWENGITLSAERRNVEETVTLLPIPESKEGFWATSMGSQGWFPKRTGWEFGKTGARIAGDGVALFATEENRDFNFYKDFTMTVDLRLANGKSVAWVARAKDLSNYYLFEINGPQSDKRNKFIFYVCRDGVCAAKAEQDVLDKINPQGDDLTIVFEARGDQFTTRLSVGSAPKVTIAPNQIAGDILGIFRDRSFSIGGVGFCGKAGVEALLVFLNIRL